MFRFYGDEILAPCPTAGLRGHPLSAVRDCFSVSAGSLLIRYLGKAHVLVAWTRQLRATVNKLGILNSESWFFRAMAMMSVVFGDVMLYNLLKMTKVSEETTMFIFGFRGGASETSVNLCQNTVNSVSRQRAR